MVNAKKKGNAGENDFSAFLRSHGFKAFRDSASGASTHKSDIVNGLDYSMEIKTVKRINLKDAWRQVTRDASIAHNSPLLAVHLDGMPDKTWIICISSNDWIEMEKEVRVDRKIGQNATYSAVSGVNMPLTSIDDIRALKYATEAIKASAQKLLKILP